MESNGLTRAWEHKLEGKPVGIMRSAMVIPGLLEWEDLRAGKSAVRFLTGEAPVPTGAPTPLVVDPPQDWPFLLMPRALGLALAALERLDYEPGRPYGMVLGMPNLFSETAYLEWVLPHRDQPEFMEALLGFSHDFPLNFLAERAGCQGPRLRVDSACATGNDALIVAGQWIQAGVVDDVLVVAASAMLNPVGLALFHNLQALSPVRDLESSCPFDRRRRGFVMGEGAAAMWLSKSAGPDCAGYLCGYGQSMNAEKFIDLPKDLEAMKAACRGALGSLERVAYVSAHGTGTPANDPVETRLHRELFGALAEGVPLSSVKSMIGHCLGAAALIEAIVCLKALRDQMAPPTINLRQPDPACDLDYCALEARAIEGNFALSNAFAFGGQNSSILLARERP